METNMSMEAMVMEANMRIHTGEKLYTCRQCGKSLINMETLKSMWEFILERALSTVNSVEKVSTEKEILITLTLTERIIMVYFVCCCLIL